MKKLLLLAALFAPFQNVNAVMPKGAPEPSTIEEVQATRTFVATTSEKKLGYVLTLFQIGNAKAVELLEADIDTGDLVFVQPGDPYKVIDWHHGIARILINDKLFYTLTEFLGVTL